MNQFEEVRKGIALNVELRIALPSKEVGQLEYVSRSRVSSIWTRVDRDATGPSLEAGSGRGEDVRLICVAHVTDQRDLIEVDAQECHQEYVEYVLTALPINCILITRVSVSPRRCSALSNAWRVRHHGALASAL